MQKEKIELYVDVDTVRFLRELTKPHEMFGEKWGEELKHLLERKWNSNRKQQSLFLGMK